MSSTGTTIDVGQFLSRYGYLTTSSGTGEMTEAIGAFQGFVGISVTGELDEDTFAEMNKPRCTNMDFRKR